MIRGYYSKAGYEVWQNDEIVFEGEFAASRHQSDLTLNEIRTLCINKAETIAVERQDVFHGVHLDT